MPQNTLLAFFCFCNLNVLRIISARSINNFVFAAFCKYLKLMGVLLGKHAACRLNLDCLRLLRVFRQNPNFWLAFNRSLVKLCFRFTGKKVAHVNHPLCAFWHYALCAVNLRTAPRRIAGKSLNQRYSLNDHGFRLGHDGHFHYLRVRRVNFTIFVDLCQKKRFSYLRRFLLNINQ